MQESKWLVTPGLSKTVKEFISFCDVLLSEEYVKPVMIRGDSGVGKSMFIQIYKNIMVRQKKINTKNIVSVNIASLNKNMIESELFGHVLGAFTDAVIPRDGLIKKAENGLLILEEIGELPKFIQAKLLTFIEDGMLRPVGADEATFVKTTIISTTNKKKNKFRLDFWNRFLTYPIPAIYCSAERRVDVLYFLHDKYPELVQSLRKNDVLALLSYNWPGNVREIERVGAILFSLDRWRFDNPSEYTAMGVMSHLPHENMLLDSPINNADRFWDFAKDLREYCIDTDSLNLFFRSVGFNLLPVIKQGSKHVMDMAFKKKISPIEIVDMQKQNRDYLDMNFVMGIEAFNSYKDSIRQLCIMLSSDYNQIMNNDLLDIKKGDLFCENTECPRSTINYPPWGESNERLRSQINQYRLEPQSHKEVIDIFSMTKDELLHYYFQGISKQCEGNRAAIGRRAGLSKAQIYESDIWSKYFRDSDI
jgi:hypothetical protein